MRRKLCTFCSALSLLLCAAIFARWIASTSHDAHWICWSNGRLMLIGADGRAAVRFAQWYIDPSVSRFDPNFGDDYRGRRSLWASLRQGRDPVESAVPLPGTLAAPESISSPTPTRAGRRIGFSPSTAGTPR